MCWTSASDFDHTEAKARMLGEGDGPNGPKEAHTRRRGSRVLLPLLQAEVQVLYQN